MLTSVCTIYVGFSSCLDKPEAIKFHRELRESILEELANQSKPGNFPVLVNKSHL